MKKLLVIIGIIAAMSGAALAKTSVHTPAKGSAERKAILDGVRKHRKAPNELYTPRVFNVSGSWAYVAADDPSDPGVDTSAFDYVLHKSGKNWKVVDEVNHTEGTSYAQEIKRIRKNFPGAPSGIFTPAQ